ncbi:hypothetical protein ARAM_007360 [Aspergillus rambellii]|uniref:Uncharacterized protein n=1 Tax=Aspergillus rambellii TaxID=308745 RepID=A0A0F8WXJ3_9EURO|nr:hypothetical protein ARAM_007360 [Aspergillus rambellii]
MAESTSAEPKEAEQSKDNETTVGEEPNKQETLPPLASAVDSGEEATVEDKLVDDLAQCFESLSLVDVVPSLSEEAVVSSRESTTVPAWLPETKLVAECNLVSASNISSEIASYRQPPFVSGASVDTPPMASIYSDVPPSFPTMELFRTAERVQQCHSTIFLTPVLDTPSSIYGDGPEPCRVISHEGQQIVGRPLVSAVLEEDPEFISRPTLYPPKVKRKEWRRIFPTPKPRAWIPTPLSPIPEERGFHLHPSSSARAGQIVTPDTPHGNSPVIPAVTPAVTPAPTQDAPNRTHKSKKLTTKKVNRKRSHTQATSETRAEPETPYANKRRNLGPPGSTPYARRLTHLSRRISTNSVPYSERLLRRRAESQGRIHRTVFRLPQLVAQTEADRQASATPPFSPSPEPLQTDFDFSAEQTPTDDQNVTEQPAISQEPCTPEPPRRGWNIRGIFSSVPRSFSRFLPSFSRTPERSEVSVVQQPASERVQRIQLPEADSTAVVQRDSQSRRRSSEQPPSLYLGDLPTKPSKSLSSLQAPKIQPLEQDASQEPEAEDYTARGRDGISQERNMTAETAKKKRKRSSSPDVIPNPAGSSYGMDLDYFCYSSDSDEESELPAPRTEPRKVDALAKSAAQNAIQSERPASKKVRFDASPEDTPSKLRLARATDPYRGRHFIGMGGPQTFSAPTTPTPVSRPSEPSRPPGFIPNKQGTFQLDYDAFSDDSESSGAPSPPDVHAPSAVPQTPTSTQPNTAESTQPSASHLTPRPTLPPSTPAKVDEEALARARSQAEKYKPKTPSGLRTTSRYSSPLTLTPDINITPAPPAEEMTEKFGDDQFAQDAQWLYENCPSGDLRQLVWPAKQSFAESLNASPAALKILSEIWDDADVDKAYAIFKRELREFEKTLA